jgi:hypothetical protein
MHMQAACCCVLRQYLSGVTKQPIRGWGNDSLTVSPAQPKQAQSISDNKLRKHQSNVALFKHITLFLRTCSIPDCNTCENHSPSPCMLVCHLAYMVSPTELIHTLHLCSKGIDQRWFTPPIQESTISHTQQWSRQPDHAGGCCRCQCCTRTHAVQGIHKLKAHTHSRLLMLYAWQ